MIPQHPRVPKATILTLCALVLFLGLLWLLGPTSPTYAQSQPQALGSLSGVVRNDQGDPIPNITVWLQQYTRQYQDRQVTTNAQGIYEFLSVYSGDYRLLFQDAENQYASAYYTGALFDEDAAKISVNGKAVSGIDMELTLGGAISITLQNADPITTSYYSARLFRQNANGRWSLYQEGWSAEGGNKILFSNLAAGSYHLCAEGHIRDDYQPSLECYDNVLPANYGQVASDASDIHVASGAETDLAITLNDISQVQGIVRHGNNQPAADIYVTLLQLYPYGAQARVAGVNGGYITVQTRESDEDGHFHFGFLPSGAYKLVFNYPNYEQNSDLTTFYPEQLSDLNGPDFKIDPSTRLNITQQLTPQSRMIGKLTLPNHTPLGGATLIVYKAMPDGSWLQPACLYLCPTAIYDSSTGVFTMTQLTAGRYRLSAEQSVGGSIEDLQGFYGGPSLESASDIVLATGETKRNIDFILGANHFDSSISGIVKANNKALAGIEVGLFMQNLYPYIEYAQMPLLTTITDQAGRYKLEGLAPGTYRVAFRDPNGIYATSFYSNAEQPNSGALIVIAQTGEIANINVTLTPGATVRGHVRTKNGEPPGGYVLQVVLNDPVNYNGFPLPYIEERSDADGSFEVTGLAPGNYFMRVLVPIVGDGTPIDGPSNTFRYFSSATEPYNALPISLEAGQTLEGKDILLFDGSAYYLPMIIEATPSR